MKISDLISELVTEWWRHGDVNVAVDDGYDPHSPELDYADGKLYLW